MRKACCVDLLEGPEGLREFLAVLGGPGPVARVIIALRAAPRHESEAASQRSVAAMRGLPVDARPRGRRASRRLFAAGRLPTRNVGRWPTY